MKAVIEDAPSHEDVILASALIGWVEHVHQGTLVQEFSGKDPNNRKLTVKRKLLGQTGSANGISGHTELIYDELQRWNSSEASFYVEGSGRMGIRDVLDNEPMSGPYDTNPQTAAPRIARLLQPILVKDTPELISQLLARTPQRQSGVPISPDRVQESISWTPESGLPEPL